MAKIKTNKSTRFGVKVLTKVGEVSFDGEGEAEVSDKQAIFLVNNDSSIEIVGKMPKVTGSKSDDGDGSGEQGSQGSQGDDQGGTGSQLEDPEDNSGLDDKEDLKAELMNLEMEDLRAMCEKANLPKNKYVKLGKDKLVKYVADNVKFEETSE